jgi:hypothetical protein
MVFEQLSFGKQTRENTGAEIIAPVFSLVRPGSSVGNSYCFDGGIFNALLPEHQR